MAARTPVQIAKEIESIQALVGAGSLSDAAGRAAIEQLTAELVATAAAPTKAVRQGVGDDLPMEPAVPLDSGAATPAAPVATAAPGSQKSAEECVRGETEQIEALRPKRFRGGTPRTPDLPAPPAPISAEPSWSAVLAALSSSATGASTAPDLRASAPLRGARFTRGQVAFATFFGMFFAGSLLSASNAYADRRPVRSLLRLLGFVVYVPIVGRASSAGSSWFPVVLVNAVFALLFSQIDSADPKPKSAESAWKVAAAVAGGWIGWWMFVMPLFAAVTEVVHRDALEKEATTAPRAFDLDAAVREATPAPAFDLDALAKEIGVKQSASPEKRPVAPKPIVDVTPFLGCYLDGGAMLNWHEHIVTMSYNDHGAIMYVQRTTATEAAVRVRFANPPLVDGSATLRVVGGSVAVVQGGRTLWTLPLRSREPQGCL